MSRIGNTPIDIPAGVNISVDSGKVSVTGPKGSLDMELRPEVKAEVADNQLLVKRKKNDRVSRSLHGLYRSSIFNMVKGVSEGWTKNLEMVGVGYRAAGGGDKITLS